MTEHHPTLHHQADPTEKLIDVGASFSEPEIKKPPHWYWDSWVCLSLTSMLFFTAANLIIAETSVFGLGSMIYCSSGAVIYCVIYFYVTSKRNIQNRVLLFQDGQLSFTLIKNYFIGAIFGSGIFFAISITFKTCGYAGLNIGIAQTIWGFTPFLTSIMDFFIHGTKLETYQIGGLVCMFAAAACISLSNLFTDPIEQGGEYTLPVIVPVLVSFTMPLICSLGGMWTKGVFMKTHINPNDFTVGYFFVMKTIATLISPIYFYYNPINWRLYWVGFIGSFFDITGSVFANAAIGTGGPVGPIFALVDSQIVIVTIVAAARMGLLPHWMQLLGLAFGVCGTIVLSLTRFFCAGKVDGGH